MNLLFWQAACCIFIYFFCHKSIKWHLRQLNSCFEAPLTIRVLHFFSWSVVLGGVMGVWGCKVDNAGSWKGQCFPMHFQGVLFQLADCHGGKWAGGTFVGMFTWVSEIQASHQLTKETKWGPHTSLTELGSKTPMDSSARDWNQREQAMCISLLDHSGVHG